MSAKIAVVGNCQAAVLAKCLELLSRSETTNLPVWDLSKLHPSDEQLVEFLSAYDFVFAQPQMLSKKVEDALANLVLFPNLQFSAFHPDIVYAGSLEQGSNFGTGVHSATGDYSSALVLFGYMENFSKSEIANLFCSKVFEGLGYFSLWHSCEHELLTSCRTIGTPIDELFFNWTRRGCFMHSFNHPKLFVIADIAKELCRITGLHSECVDCEQYMQDPGVDGEISPLYPEIAQRLGLQGGYVFKRSGSVLVSHASALLLGLNDFIFQSLEAYAKFDPKFINCSRIIEWGSDAEVTEFLRKMAKGS